MRIGIVLMPFPPHEPETAERIKKTEHTCEHAAILFHITDSIRHEIARPALSTGKRKTLHAVHNLGIISKYREETFLHILTDTAKVHMCHSHSGADGDKLSAPWRTFFLSAEDTS